MITFCFVKVGCHNFTQSFPYYQKFRVQSSSTILNILGLDRLMRVVDRNQGKRAESQLSDATATANVLFMFLNRNKVLVCPMKSAPVMLTLSDSKHVVLPVDDDSDLNVVASFDRRGEYIYTGNAKGKVSLEAQEPVK